MNAITHQVDNSTKRYPRTLQEAFGPHTSSQIWAQPDPMHPKDRIVVRAALIAGVAGLIVILFS